MSRGGDRKTQDEQLLETLADELSATPLSELAADLSRGDLLKLGARLLGKSKAEAGKRAAALERPAPRATGRPRRALSGRAPRWSAAQLRRRRLPSWLRGRNPRAAGELVCVQDDFYGARFAHTELMAIVGAARAGGAL